MDVLYRAGPSTAFCLAFATQQITKGIGNRLLFIEHLIHLFGDGHVHTGTGTQVVRTLGGFHPFCHLTQFIEDLVQGLALSQPQADPAISRQIAPA